MIIIYLFSLNIQVIKIIKPSLTSSCTPRFSATFSSSGLPNRSPQHFPSRVLPRLQPKPLLCWRMDCSIRQSSCCMISTTYILCRSYILQCCISCPALYTHSESHYIGMVDLVQRSAQKYPMFFEVCKNSVSLRRYVLSYFLLDHSNNINKIGQFLGTYLQ